MFPRLGQSSNRKSFREGMNNQSENEDGVRKGGQLAICIVRDYNFSAGSWWQLIKGQRRFILQDSKIFPKDVGGTRSDCNKKVKQFSLCTKKIFCRH